MTGKELVTLILALPPEQQGWQIGYEDFEYRFCFEPFTELRVHTNDPIVKTPGVFPAESTGMGHVIELR